MTMMCLTRQLTAVFALGICLLSLPANADEYADAISLFNKKDYKAAAQKFQHSLPAASDKSNALYYLGISHQAMGDGNKAKYYYEQVIQKFPTSQAANYALQILHPSAQESASTTSSASTNSPSSSQDNLDSLPNEVAIPFERGTQRHMYVNAYINGKALRMMFDTGASSCAMSFGQLKSLGIVVPKDAQKIRVSGTGGVVDGKMFEVDITLGKIKRHKVKMIGYGGADNDPLLGQTFFDVLNYNIDNPNGVIRFRKKGLKKSLGYDAIEVPFTRSGNNLIVDVKINGKPTEMTFDTGAYGVVMDPFSARALGLKIPEDARYGASGGIGGMQRSVTFFVDRMELGPVLRTHIPITLQEGAPGLLGQDFFANRPFEIDYEKSVIRFSH